MPPSYLNAILRDNLACFIAKTFKTVDPAAEYLHNWHIDLIADRLEQATRGEITRLIINVPPRSLKSVAISVAWPAWLLGKNPALKIMAASYSQLLSLKHSQDCRLVMESDWYRQVFPKTEIADGQNEKFKFVTTSRGFRFATSVGGTATGEGGDFLIVDDPHNPLQAASDIQRQSALDWFDQTFISRLNNKKNGVIILVMQRLHVDDLTGHLLSKNAGKWQHLCLPAVAPSPVTYHFYHRTKTREAGEILHESREGEGEINSIKNDLGSYAFAAQYQQSPVLLAGGMVELGWFRRYNAAPGGKIVQSWDMAIKAGKNNDYSVCTTWAEAENGYYLLDVFARKMEYPELKRTTIAMAEKFNPEAILIEDKASGQSLLQDLRRETKLPLLAISVSQDKISRFAAVTAMIEAGKILLPNNAAWLVDYEAEMLGFPNAPHDDMVDSTSQFLNWVRGRRQNMPRIRVL